MATNTNTKDESASRSWWVEGCEKEFQEDSEEDSLTRFCVDCEKDFQEDWECAKHGWVSTKCVPCSSGLGEPEDSEDEECEFCECCFPKFIVDDGIQRCSRCGKDDHYKNGVVADWSEDDDDDDEPHITITLYKEDVLRETWSNEKWAKFVEQYHDLFAEMGKGCFRALGQGIVKDCLEPD